MMCVINIVLLTLKKLMEGFLLKKKLFRGFHWKMVMVYSFHALKLMGLYLRLYY